MSQPRRRWLWLLACVCSLLVVASATAHELRPASLALEEIEPGRFLVSFKPAVAASGTELASLPSFPAHCHYTPSELDCRPRGLVGDIGFLELGAHRAVVQIAWLRVGRSVRWLDADSPTFSVNGTPSDATLGERATLSLSYLRLGIEHILSGVDHLLFVIGLTLLIGKGRRLLAAITAFTLAHSLTLAANVLGVSHVPAAPVEASIALSIVLVCAECLHARPTLARRAPWLVALGFGLLHGFGFAGALRDIGLPPHQTPLALLFFNLGVEVGQLLAIASFAFLAFVVRRPLLRAPWLPRAFIYAMGTTATYWSIERVLAVFRA